MTRLGSCVVHLEDLTHTAWLEDTTAVLLGAPIYSNDHLGCATLGIEPWEPQPLWIMSESLWHNLSSRVSILSPLSRLRSQQAPEQQRHRRPGTRAL